jgi:4-hydroxy-4-methyl-2-oxoglutarate aldolase
MNEALQQKISVLGQFSVCQILDAMGDTLPFEIHIRPVHPSFRICGSVFTVECASGDNLTLHHALHLAQRGNVLVVNGSFEAALWGELMSISAQQKGLAGTIIDGSVRDAFEIQELAYPVFCRGFHPKRAAKQSYGRINLPIQVGVLRVAADDVICADVNGIVCFPLDRLDEVVERTTEVGRKETDLREQIVQGRTIFEVFELERSVRAKLSSPQRSNPQPK